MLGITCSKCGRRFTPSNEDLQGYLAQSEGKKYALVLCPHCNYGNKIPLPRLHQAVRGAPEAPAAETPAPIAPAPEAQQPETPGPEAGSGERAETAAE